LTAEAVGHDDILVVYGGPWCNVPTFAAIILVGRVPGGNVGFSGAEQTGGGVKLRELQKYSSEIASTMR
jgi:hypothetical protein